MSTRSTNALGAFGAVLLAVAALLPAHARATDRGDAPARATSEFWRNVREPGYRRARALLRHGLVLLYQLERGGEMGPHERNAIVERALHRFELARQLAPTDAEIAFLLARATALWEAPSDAGPATRLDDLAIERFVAVRAADPELMPEAVAFELGILYTRLARYAEAAAEYERAISYELDPEPTKWMNLAEVSMLAGDLTNAVTRYERSIEISRDLGDAAVLPLFGLAVALDRLGEHRRARETMREALVAAGGTTDPLHAPGVFFVPPCEIHWYEGLAAQARAEDQALTEAERAEARQRARTSFTAFLSEGGERSRWADLARARVEELAAPAAAATRPARAAGGRRSPPGR